MPELVYLVAVSVDGFIAGPGGDITAFPTEGDHIEALVEELPETLPGHVLAALGVTLDEARFDRVVMGWNTYALAYEHGVADPYPHLETTVFSRSRSSEGVRVLDVDPLAHVQEAKRSGGDIWLCGGGGLASAVAPAIDRLLLKVNPIVLGRGVPLFRDETPSGGWTLESSRRFESGVVMNDYRRA